MSRIYKVSERRVPKESSPEAEANVHKSSKHKMNLSGS